MKWGRVILVVFGAIILTALGIDAADTISGKDGTLLSQVIKSQDTGLCSPGMREVVNVPGITCVDAYEVSPGKDCPAQDPQNLLGSMQNLETPACVPESKQDAIPWRFVTRDQAMQACERVGKRLPTSEEWYALSLGVVAIDTSCNISSHSVSKTGAYPSCITPHGAYDMVGNVWEWVSDDVVNGTYKDKTLPEEGYVAQVDQAGMAIVTTEDAQPLFGGDYFWSDAGGVYGIIRGGYYDSGADGGIYTVHADTLPTTASIGIGFRCVK